MMTQNYVTGQIRARLLTVSTFRVLVAPIALMPVEGTQLRVAVYRPRGEWVTAEVNSGASADDAAAELLGRMPKSAGSAAPSPQGEPVSFLTADAVTLIYTAVLPISAVLATDSDLGKEWVQLAPWVEDGQTLKALDVVQQLVLNYWRQVVEETTAAFDLLPRYFTTTQVRAVYASLWGARQDPGNFHRWLHVRNEGLCRVVSDQTIRRRVGVALDDESNALGYPTSWDALGGTGLVGVSPTAVGRAAKLVPALGLVAAAVAGTVAFQEKVSRGKPPDWYTRSHPHRKVLPEIYTPRPAWLAANMEPIAT